MAIQKINLNNMDVMIDKIKVDTDIINKIVADTGVTKVKAKDMMAASTDMVVAKIQANIDYDKVVMTQVKDDAGNVIETLLFHKVSSPFKEIDKVQISAAEIDRLLQVALDEKANVTEVYRKKVAALRAVKDLMVSPVPDDDL